MLVGVFFIPVLIFKNATPAFYGRPALQRQIEAPGDPGASCRFT
jgi:hypothetical protein